MFIFRIDALQTVHNRTAFNSHQTFVRCHLRVRLNATNLHREVQLNHVAWLPCPLNLDISMRGLRAHLLAIHRDGICFLLGISKGIEVASRHGAVAQPARDADLQGESLGLARRYGQLHLAIPGIFGLLCDAHAIPQKGNPAVALDIQVYV